MSVHSGWVIPIYFYIHIIVLIGRAYSCKFLILSNNFHLVSTIFPVIVKKEIVLVVQEFDPCYVKDCVPHQIYS